MIPVWVLRALPYVAAVCLVGLVCGYSYHKGGQHTAARYELQISLQQQAAADFATLAERRQRETERAAAADLAAVSVAHIKEQDHAKATIDRLRADVRAGRHRLSVAVTSCTASAAGAGADPAAAGGPGAEARAELMPAAADRIISIAADGDAAVRQLNRVIDAYNALRDRFNAQPP